MKEKELKGITNETLYLTLSRTAERASYYGFRSILVLFLINESINLSHQEAIKFFGWFGTAILIGKVLGGVLGDLVSGNKKTLLIGAVLQFLGAILVLLSSSMFVYSGMLLFVLGSGLYDPNLLAFFGKKHSNQSKQLDASFGFLYISVIVGTVIGVILIGNVAESVNYELAFSICGLLSLISIIPVVLIKDSKTEVSSKNVFIHDNSNALKVVFTMLIAGLFWGAYEVVYQGTIEIRQVFSETSSLDIPSYLWSTLDSLIIIPVGIACVALWFTNFSKSSFKIMVGCIFGTASYLLLYAIPEVPSDTHSYIYIISLLLFSIAEIHIAPIVFSVITKYTNPKYLASVMALSFIPAKLVMYDLSSNNNSLYIEPGRTLNFGVLVMFLLSIGLIYYTFSFYKKLKSKEGLAK